MSLVTICVCNEQFYNESPLFVSFINAFFNIPEFCGLTTVYMKNLENSSHGKVSRASHENKLLT